MGVSAPKLRFLRHCVELFSFLCVWTQKYDSNFNDVVSTRQQTPAGCRIHCLNQQLQQPERPPRWRQLVVVTKPRSHRMHTSDIRRRRGSKQQNVETLRSETCKWRERKVEQRGAPPCLTSWTSSLQEEEEGGGHGDTPPPVTSQLLFNRFILLTTLCNVQRRRTQL